jgi:hypothetical protein
MTPSREQAKNNEVVILRRHLFKLGLVDMHLKQPHMLFVTVRG